MIGPTWTEIHAQVLPSAVPKPELKDLLKTDTLSKLKDGLSKIKSARLRPESEAAIAEVAIVLRRHPDWKVRLSGHTDNIGGDDANLTLSRARAEAVRQAIAQRLADGGGRLEAAGFGATAPRESNDTPEGRARNRRVEIARLR